MSSLSALRSRSGAAEPREVGRRYERTGLLAIDPQALMLLFAPPDIDARNETIGDVEIVDVRGPIDQHASEWCDSYSAILERVQVACDGPARAIVLRIDSPGGEVGGCFDAARAMRAKCSRAGKPLHAFVVGKACSAAYALACAAASVSISDTAVVGSIGVINTRADFSARNAESGVRYAIVASGAHKTDGHPDYPITEAELADTQLLVDSLAGVFFALVSEMRAMPPEEIAQQQARIYHGQSAVDSRLADTVQTFDQMLAQIAGGTGDQMATAYDKAIAALKEAAAINDANGAAAKKALAAMGAADEPEPAEPEEKPAEPETPPAAAATTAAPAATVSAATAVSLATHGSDLAARVHALETTHEQETRTALLAARPDVPGAMLRLLADKPIGDVRAMLAAIPVTAPNLAATATVTGTRGEGQGCGNAARLDPQAKAALDAEMGLATQVLGVREDGHRLLLGAFVSPLPTTETRPAR